MNGLRIPAKRRAIFKELHKLKADICLLQETHATSADQKIWASEWGGKILFSNGTSNSRGVAALLSRHLDIQVSEIHKDTDGRLMIIQADLEEERITIANIYAPTQSESREQVSFISECERVLANLDIHTLLLGGDFNTQLALTTQGEERILITNGSMYRTQIQSIMSDYALTDIWGAKNPQSKRGTFRRGGYTARLDYWLIPEYLQVPDTKIDIIPQALSDHSLLLLDIGPSPNARGPGHWKFNNDLLVDPEFRRRMIDCINLCREDDLSNPNAMWEWLKFKIRLFVIQYHANKKREQRKLEKSLRDRLLFLDNDQNTQGHPDPAEEIASIKRELKEIALIEANKTIFRAKARWTMEGEKPSAYFLGLEKRRAKDMNITALKDSTGRILTSNTDILERQREYYTHIYEEDPESLDDLDDFPLSSADIPTISDLSKLLMDRPFTMEEFHSSLKALNKGKSPGSDGLTPEFYLQFWDVLRTPFMDSILFSLENGSLSEGQRTGLIRLIPKKGQDRQEVANWRPITLLNVDFKILSKTIASRIQTVMNQIISPDQTGFMRGRYIGSNLNNITALIDHVEATNTSAILLAVDYQKAFDTVRWKLIFKALQLFGFGEYITSAIKIMFKDIKTAVCNAGYSSEFFFPSRGIRQGCCASPSLFTITVELLAILVRQSIAIRGISVGDSSFKISQYADDSTFFLQDFQALDALSRLLNQFSRFSGLVVNRKKSHLLLLGNHLHPPTTYKGISVRDQVKILGLYFKRNITDEEQYRLNFEPQLKKITQICRTWINRNMSLKGKAILIKSLLVSLLQFPSSATHTPSRVFSEFKKIMLDFLWSGKRNKIAYALITQKTEDGGLGLPDFESRVSTSLLSWIRRLWLDPNSCWAQILQFHLQLTDIKQTLFCKTNLSDRLPKQFTFLRQIMTTWAKYHTYEPWTEEDIKHESLWLNDYITVGGRTLSWSEWRSSGILTINDLWHPTQPRFLSDEEIRNAFSVPCSFLQLLQIRAAIPSKWKRLLQTNTAVTPDPKPHILTGLQSYINVEQASSKKIYQALTGLKMPSVSSQIKWNTDFPVDEQTIRQHWQVIYKIPYRSIRETKIQAFQYRLLHRIIPCNKYLSNIRIRQDDLCPNCGERDTLQHFFLDCSTVQEFWTKLGDWLAANADFRLPLTPSTVLFGKPYDSPTDKISNFILLVAKFFIYRQRLFHGTDLNIIQFLMELRNKLKVEKFICGLEGKPNKFNPWKRILAALG